MQAIHARARSNLEPEILDPRDLVSLARIYTALCLSVLQHFSRCQRSVASACPDTFLSFHIWRRFSWDLH